MAVPAWLLIGVLAVWFGASAVVQIRDARTRWIRRFDPFGLIPRWNLFSPRPIASDLVVRYRLWPPGQPSEPSLWHTLPFPRPRRATDGLFSSERRAKRTVYGHALTCVDVYSRYPKRPDLVMGTSAYLHLLARASREAVRSGASEVQFQVLKVHRSTGTEETSALFRSAVHEV